MVLSGLLYKRVLASAVLTMALLVPTFSLRAAEPDNVVGTMPEDYVPQLKQLLTQALTRNPDMIARDYDRVIQEARYLMAKSARLPGVGGNFDYGISESASTNNSAKSRNTGAQYSFNIGQALFHWGAIKNEIEMSRLNVIAGGKDTARMYREITVTLRKAYLALIVQKSKLVQAREAVELGKVDVEIAEAKMKDGTISAAALAGEQLRLRETRLALDRVLVDFTANRQNLARVAGIPEAELPESSVPSEIPKPVYHEAIAAEITARTLRDNARGTLEWEIYDLKLRDAELRQRVVSKRLYPKFGIGAGYSLRNNTYVNGPTVNQEAVTEQRIAISGSWQIFDGFATTGAKREAAAARRALEHKKASEIDQLLQSLQQIERALKVEAEALELADLRHDIAVNGQDIVKEGVEMGTLPRGDLRRGALNIMSTLALRLQARAEFLMRWTELVTTAGADPLLKNLPDRNARK